MLLHKALKQSGGNCLAVQCLRELRHVDDLNGPRALFCIEKWPPALPDTYAEVADLLSEGHGLRGVALNGEGKFSSRVTADTDVFLSGVIKIPRDHAF